MSAQIIDLPSTDSVDRAWDAYAAHVARSRFDHELLLDRDYVSEWARLERRFKDLFLRVCG